MKSPADPAHTSFLSLPDSLPTFLNKKVRSLEKGTSFFTLLIGRFRLEKGRFTTRSQVEILKRIDEPSTLEEVSPRSGPFSGVTSRFARESFLPTHMGWSQLRGSVDSGQCPGGRDAMLVRPRVFFWVVFACLELRGSVDSGQCPGGRDALFRVFLEVVPVSSEVGILPKRTFCSQQDREGGREDRPSAECGPGIDFHQNM